MKLFYGSLLAIFSFNTFAQTTLVPGKKSFEKKWITPTKSTMIWYSLKDTAKFEMARVTMEIQTANNQLLYISQVKLKNMKSSWVDTSIADLKTLTPIYHSSYNMQRDMVINYGEVVTGYYKDKMKKNTTLLNDSTDLKYFDSNIYPVLLGWLPLSEHYTKEIAIYEFNPAGKKGVIKAFVKDVTTGTYQSNNLGLRDVWIVTVSDEISDGTSIYYFDKKDRKLWQQVINAGGRKMLMQAEE